MNMSENVDFEIALSESLADITLYHGSERDLRILKPDAINVGTRLSSPRWSVFFWRDAARARDWAVFSALRAIYRDKAQRQRVGVSTLAFDPRLGRGIVLAGELSSWIRANREKSVFVYEVSIPIWKVGLGHSPNIEEYTVDEPVSYLTKKKIDLSEETIEASVVTVESKEELQSYVDGVWNSLRGRTGEPLMRSDYYETFNLLSRELAAGKIRPGQSLSNHLP